MAKLFICVAALLGGLAVGLGAFGAHALKKILENNQRLDTYELAVKYQFYHTLVLLLLGLALLHFSHRLLHLAGFAFIGGILLFSGSLYVLSLTNLRWLGAVTPFGGLAFLIGWLFLLLGVFWSKN